MKTRTKKLQTNDDTQNYDSKQSHTELLEPNPNYDKTHEQNENPTEQDPKHTEKSDTGEFETRKQMLGKKNLEQNGDEQEETKDEAHFQTPLIDKVIETTPLLIRTAFLQSQNLLVRLRIAMRTAAQEEVEAINAHVELLPGPCEPDDILEEQEN